MADTARELAADYSLVACQLLEFQKLTRSAPRLHSLEVNHTYTDNGYVDVLDCHIHRVHYNRKDERIELGHEEQIDALRIWAHKLGSDLHLSDPTPNASTYTPGTAWRSLSTATVLPNGLHVKVSTFLYYDVEAPEYHGRPAAPAISVT